MPTFDVPNDTIYSTTSTAWGGREGRSASEDGRLDVTLSVPKSMGGDAGPGANPEQLFATGYAACFHSALKSVARKLLEGAHAHCPYSRATRNNISQEVILLTADAE